MYTTALHISTSEGLSHEQMFQRWSLFQPQITVTNPEKKKFETALDLGQANKELTSWVFALADKMYPTWTPV